MSFEKTFCPSPWFHTRIFNDGTYGYCRWSGGPQTDASRIQTMDPIHWFQKGMAPIREKMLQGDALPNCKHCYLMERHHKVSGRQKQLLKIGVKTDHFAPSMISSPWFGQFEHSHVSQGITDQWPQDWQIDLGNHCNSACIFCSPIWSSRLAVEYKQLGLIDNLPPPSWCDDPQLLEKFISVLEQSPDLVYLHFIGGETLITPAFTKILERLVRGGIAGKITIGFTTNVTVWEPRVVELLAQFQNVNLGISIECFHDLNNYLRYPSKIDQCVTIIQRWLAVAQQHQWLTQIRTTPTVFSIWHLDTVYDFAYRHGIGVESCNFLDRPEHMRPSVLPAMLRSSVVDKLSRWINNHKDSTETELVINTRNPDMVYHQIVQDAQSYVEYLQNQQDESYRLPDLVRHIKIVENHRDNCVLTYLPEYEQLLRSAGY